MRSSSKICYACGSHKTYVQIGNDGYRNAHWYSNPPIGWLCEKCNNKYVKNPKWHPIKNCQRIWFQYKQIQLKQNPKIGVCNWCRAVVGFDCKRTHTHHEKYDSMNYLAYAIELCASCHGVETTRRLGRRL